MSHEDVIWVLEEINQLLYKQSVAGFTKNTDRDDYEGFGELKYETNGFYGALVFLDYAVWDDQNDPRFDKKEEFLEYVKQQINLFIDRIKIHKL